MKTLQLEQPTNNVRYVMGQKKMQWLTANIKHFVFALMLCLAVLTGYSLAQQKTVPVRETAIAEEPIINKDAVTDYKNGEITREVAVGRIEKRLNELKDYGHIRDWEYVNETREYIVTLKNGAIFSYKLQ